MGVARIAFWRQNMDTAEKRQSETDGVSSTSVGGGKNVTSTPFVLRGHHVTTAPLDDSLFDPTAAPCCTNSLNEMSSIAELSESSSTITHTDITNIESEVSSIKDPSGDGKSSTLDRGFCASSLADSNIASQSSASPLAPSISCESSPPAGEKSEVQESLKEANEGMIEDCEEDEGPNKMATDVQEADKIVVEDTEKPLELLEERLEESNEKSNKKPETSVSTAVKGLSCAGEQEMQQSTAKDTSVAVGNDSMSTSSGIYLDDNTATQRKTQTNGGRPKRTRLTMAERATMEALASFGGSGLDSVLKNKTETFRDKLEKDKLKLKSSSAAGAKRERENEKEDVSTTFKRTRLELVIEESNKLFKDIPVGDSAAKEKQPQKADEAESQVDSGRRMTRLEQARLEALQSFGGHGLHDVMTTSKRVVSRTLEAKRKKLEEDKEEREKENQVDSLSEVSQYTSTS